MRNKLTGTKEVIFDTFIEMVSTFGYESVSMRDISGKIGVQVAAIYNHFKSKRHILDFVYAYYTEYLYENRNSLDDVKKLIETASAEEIISMMDYNFVSENKKHYRRMILITKIVYMRLYQDEAASKIFFDSTRNNAKYLTDLLEYAIEIGRLKPNFDVKTFADSLIGAKQIMGIKAFADPNYTVGQLAHEKQILALFSQLLGSALFT